MHSKKILVSLLVLLVSLVGCNKPLSQKEGKPTVLVSLAPYAYIVKKIAGDLVKVETLIPEGANPHIYEASPQTVQSHQHAALWIYLGKGFDKKMLQFLKETGQEIKTLDLATGVTLLPGPGQDSCCGHDHKEGHDLHIWMSPQLLKGQAEKITEALLAILPHEEAALRLHSSELLDELELLHGTLSTLLSSKKGEVILVSHPAFAYFCQEYGLQQLSIEVEGKDPRPQHVAEILEKAKTFALHTIITEPQHSNKGAEAIAARLGITTHRVDPYTENYVENLLLLGEIIAR